MRGLYSKYDDVRALIGKRVEIHLELNSVHYPGIITTESKSMKYLPETDEDYLESIVFLSNCPYAINLTTNKPKRPNRFFDNVKEPYTIDTSKYRTALFLATLEDGELLPGYSIVIDDDNFDTRNLDYWEELLQEQADCFDENSAKLKKGIIV